MVFDDLQAVSPLPLLSIVETSARFASESGLQTVGLLGTRFTMEGRFYPEVFGRHGITVLAPAPADLDYVHAKYTTELIAGEFRAETRDGVMAVVGRLKHAGAQGVILGGTELPLLLRDSGDCGVPLVDTTRIHVRQAVAALLA